MKIDKAKFAARFGAILIAGNYMMRGYSSPYEAISNGRFEDYIISVVGILCGLWVALGGFIDIEMRRQRCVTVYSPQLADLLRNGESVIRQKECTTDRIVRDA